MYYTLEWIKIFLHMTMFPKNRKKNLQLILYVIWNWKKWKPNPTCIDFLENSRKKKFSIFKLKTRREISTSFIGFIGISQLHVSYINFGFLSKNNKFIWKVFGFLWEQENISKFLALDFSFLLLLMDKLSFFVSQF